MVKTVHYTQIITISFLFLLLFAGCAEEEPSKNEQIFGKWTLNRVDCGTFSFHKTMSLYLDTLAVSDTIPAWYLDDNVSDDTVFVGYSWKTEIEVEIYDSVGIWNGNFPIDISSDKKFSLSENSSLCQNGNYFFTR